jgi:cellulose synthase/poly-beta-1,6-N-acetylglucosamine synthase-like glycosyltransferase
MGPNELLNILENVCFAYFGFSVVYLFIFAFFSRFKRGDHYPPVSRYNRILVLFPAYKEDLVIEASVQSFFKQEYPRFQYEVMVISDQMEDETNERLMKLPLRLIKADFEESSKAKALNFAMDNIKGEIFDMVVILDADNTVDVDFLDQINRAFQAGSMAIQAHRKGKNYNTDIALLDAVSEEMNNAFFRKGHVFLGLSSALSGSGMAFDFRWFRDNIKKIFSAGEDKELEILLLKQRIYIEYLHDVPVYDEKVQNSSAFYKQRQRWLAAQYGSLKTALKDLPRAVLTGNIDYSDKLLQWIMFPRLLLLGFISIISAVMTFVEIELALKWWTLLVFLLITFGLAIPHDMDNRALEKAIIKIPFLFILMFLNLFRLKGANKKFIHTSHGES